MQIWIDLIVRQHVGYKQNIMPSNRAVLKPSLAASARPGCFNFLNTTEVKNMASVQGVNDQEIQLLCFGYVQSRDI